MMLTIDKKKDISILTAMGASRSLIAAIFMKEGVLISFIGAATDYFLAAPFAGCRIGSGWSEWNGECRSFKLSGQAQGV